MALAVFGIWNFASHGDRGAWDTVLDTVRTEEHGSSDLARRRLAIDDLAVLLGIQSSGKCEPGIVYSLAGVWPLLVVGFSGTPSPSWPTAMLPPAR
jgi:hypothetical protein